MRKCWRNSGAIPVTKSNANSDSYTQSESNAYANTGTASPASQFC
jgi:hypothetical protein